MNPSKCNDPLGYLDELRESLASPMMQLLFPPTASSDTSINESLAALFGSTEGVSHRSSAGGIAGQFDEVRWDMAAQIAENFQQVRENALSIVSSLGFCRLYGIALPADIKSKLVSPLPAELLVPAIDVTLELLASATNDARELPARFDDAEPLEDRSYCTSLLHILMECWAVYVVVDEEYQWHVCARQGTGSRFDSWMRRLLDAMDALDNQIQQDEQVRLLSVSTELPLLDNWRKMLAEPYRDPLPWWLDGILEAAAKEVRQFIEADRTFMSAATLSNSNALAFLAKRNDEIASHAASVALAASAGEITGPAAEALLHNTWAIVGDAEVRVRLELQDSQNGSRLLVVALAGAAERTKKYRFVEVVFRSAPARELPFQLGWARLSLDANEIDGIASLVIVDADDIRRQVNLEGLSNGT